LVDRRIAIKPGHHPISLPNLDVVSIHKSHGGVDGCGVVRTIEVYCLDEMAVTFNDIGSVMGQVMLPLGSGGSMNALSHR
jgi:hypothetical protein